MNPLQAVGALFWSAVTLSVIALCADVTLQSDLRVHWKKVAFILLITAAWRVPPDGMFFHGLEYEDSYVYTVAGRQIYEHTGQTAWSDDTPLSIKACEVGSIRTCRQWEPFPEHLLGYPYVIGITAHIFGYSSSTGSIINFVAALLSALLVFSITLRLSSTPKSAFLAGCLYAAIPVSAVYGLETSAEPFSAFCILLVLQFFLEVLDERAGWSFRQVAAWCAYTSVLLLCVITKREDVVLAVACPMIALAAMLGSKKVNQKSICSLSLLVLSSCAVAVLVSHINLFQTSLNERALLSRFPLTASRLLGFVCSFLSSFIRTDWYALSFVPVLAAAITACWKRDRSGIPMLLLFGLVLIYALHVRGYYEMASGHVDPHAALRFSMNFMGLWAITAGLGLTLILRRLWRFCRPSWKRAIPRFAIVAACFGCLASLYFLTYRLRDYETEDEHISRITPAIDAEALANSNQRNPATILTMDPLVIQMYARPNTDIADLESLESTDIQALIKTAPLLFLKENARFEDADLNRYGEPIRYLLSLPAHAVGIGNGYEVLRIDFPHSTRIPRN